MTSGKFATTLGYERRYNPALQFHSKAAFVEYMTQGQPSQPANITNIVAINQGKKPLTMDTPQTERLLPHQVSHLIDADHIVVDTRPQAAFGAGYIPGALNIQLGVSEFEQRIGWITPPDAPLVLVLEQDSDAAEVLHKMAFLGLDQRVAGYLGGGIEAWIDAGLPLQTIPQISVQQLQTYLEGERPMKVLDVRDTSEWDEGHIENAHFMNYKTLPERLDELAIEPEDPVAVLCAAGMRASTACSILLMNGYRRVYNVTGGMSAWAAANLPMVDETE